MREYPTVFRQFGIKLPIKKAGHSEAKFSSQVDTIMSLSDVFEVFNDAPFSVAASNEGDWLRLCLLEEGGQLLTCSSLDPKEYGLETDAVAEPWQVMTQFVHAIFSPRVDLSQADIHSLDGSTTRRSAKEALNQLVF